MGKDLETSKISSLDEETSLKKTDEGEDGDKRKPFYVPRNPRFFEHDLRLLEGEEEDSDFYNRKKNMKNDTNFWKHDKYVEEEQMPKSKQELFDTYGYDIHSEDPLTFFEKSSHEDNEINYKKNNNDKNTGWSNKYNQSKCKTVNRFSEEDSSTRSKVKNKKENYFNDKQEKSRCTTDFKSEYSNLSKDLEVLQISDIKSKPKPHQKKEDSSRDCKEGTKKKIKSISLGSSSYNRTYSDGPLDKNKKIIIIDINDTISDDMNLSNPKKHYKKKDINSKIVLKDKVKKDAYYQSLKTLEPVNIVAKLKNLKELETQIENCDVDVNQPTGLNYYPASAPSSTKFIFPEPPDVSVNHLTPLISPNQYYFQPHFQQNVGLSMQCGYYGQPPQPNYFHGSSVAILEQHCSWPTPPIYPPLGNQVVTTAPYCFVQDRVNVVKKKERKVEYSSSSNIEPLASSTPVKTIHRYTLMRSHNLIKPNPKK